MRELTKKYIDVIEGAKTLSYSMKNALELQLKMLGVEGEETDDIVDEVLSYMDYEAMADEIGGFYEDFLTDEDFEVLIEHHRSDVGQKIHEYTPQIMQQMMELGIKYSQKVMEDYQKGKDSTTYHYIDFDGEEEGDEG